MQVTLSCGIDWSWGSRLSCMSELSFIKAPFPMKMHLSFSKVAALYYMEKGLIYSLTLTFKHEHVQEEMQALTDSLLQCIM